MCVQVSACALPWKSEINSVFLIHPLKDRLSHWTWSSLIQLAWLASKNQGSFRLCFPSAEITGKTLNAWNFYVGSGALAQALGLVSALLTKLSSQTLKEPKIRNP